MLLGIKTDAASYPGCVLVGFFNCFGIAGGDEGNEQKVEINGRKAFSTGINVSFH